MSFTGEERVLIDGTLRGARAGASFETINPATEEVLGVAADCDLADLDDAIGAARRAFDETAWSTDVAFRVRCLRQLRDAFHASDVPEHVLHLRGVPVREQAVGRDRLVDLAEERGDLGAPTGA